MSLARILMIAGGVLIAAGAVVWMLDRAGFPLGRLPGDLVWRGKTTTVYFPLATCLLLSALGSLLLYWLSKRGG